MRLKQRIRIGDMLLANEVITQEQLDAALIEQKNSGRKLGATLIHLGFVDEMRLITLLAEQYQIPFIDLADYKVKEGSETLLSEVHVRRYRAIVIDKISGEWLVGVADPTDIQAIDEIEQIINEPVRFAVVKESDLLRRIDIVYRRTHEIGKLAEELDQDLAEEAFDVNQLGVEADASDTPVVKLLRSIFEDAIQVAASDIHIEPDEEVVRIRQRVDGVLQEHVMKETRIVPALVLRLKLMANLDISEKRLPQDGRFNIVVRNHSIDVRLSTMPVHYGESVVMRLLDQGASALDLRHLGMPQHILDEFYKLIHRPHGMILVTGPTGSGKTTTLYSALSDLNHPTKKIITAEDPIEYRLARINQVQVNPKIGLTFANVLRSILRQDPDIVMVGEMRDQETVEIGLRAAMTGHLVLSTLHTNDAISTAIRLGDMGVDPYLAATAVRGILAQRLVRKICQQCQTEYKPTQQELAYIREKMPQTPDDFKLFKGRGCSQCNNTGYRGRIGVYELLKLDDALADALRVNDHQLFTELARESKNYRPLGEEAFEYAIKAITTLEEVFRVSEAYDELFSVPLSTDLSLDRSAQNSEQKKDSGNEGPHHDFGIDFE